jgi:hypothetical protein
MKQVILLLAFALSTLAVSAQTADKASAASALEMSKLDSLAKLSQQFINNNQPDSLYSLMGTAFKQQISLEKMKEIMGQFKSQLGKWDSLESQGVKDGIARYKATFAQSALDFYISQDKQGKIETFLFKPL